MDDLTSVALSSDPSSPAEPQPWWLVRGGRGRVGGSAFLDYIIQRARHNGRRVKPLDGDLRSRTLSELYPSAGPGADGDAASSPLSEDIGAIKAWFEGELDASVGDRMCRAVDFGGGDRVLQDYGHELNVGEFCERFSLGLIWAFVLGPDIEDLRHVTQVISTGAVAGGRILLVLNEGVIRADQSVEGLFNRTRAEPEFRRLLDQGAEQITMSRLTCLDTLRAQGLGFFQAASGALDRHGKRTRPTVQHMTSIWLRDMDDELTGSEAGTWLA